LHLITRISAARPRTRGRRAVRHRAAVVAVLAAVAAAIPAAPANALVYTDINDFNLCDSYITDAGNFNTSSDNWDHNVYYRWLDDPNHTTVISANNVYDLSLYGKTEIPAHNTSYRLVAWLGTTGPYSSSFKLRGRMALGTGCMYNHDGRVNR
jgi:hypothetical protein